MGIDESEQFIMREKNSDDSDVNDDDANDDSNSGDDESFRKNDSNKYDDEISDDGEDVEEEKGLKGYKKRKCKISWDDTTHFQWLENKLRSAEIISNSKTW